MRAVDHEALRRVAAEVLAGQVNDWPAAALENARNVVRLCDEEAVVRLSRRVEAFEHAATNLNARIVETSDNTYSFTYGSRGAIEAFRRVLRGEHQ